MHQSHNQAGTLSTLHGGATAHGATSEMGRLVSAIESVLSAARQQENGMVASSENAALWHALTPSQRAILQFVLRHENAGLTYLAIAYSLELPCMPGFGGPHTPSVRSMSDKTIRKHCVPLIAQGLLVRTGERGAIQLTQRGRDLLAFASRSQSA